MARSLTHVNNDESNRENSMKNDVGNKTKSHIYHLYALKMRLTCAIPDEQNTRGIMKNFHRNFLRYDVFLLLSTILIS